MILSDLKTMLVKYKSLHQTAYNIQYLALKTMLVKYKYTGQFIKKSFSNAFKNNAC